MEERLWVDRPARRITFHLRRSSNGRNWHGFEASLYDATDGYSDFFHVDHSLSMHVGQPVLVTSRCDGAHVHRLQVPGDLKMVPAGHSRIWEIAAPTTKLVLDLRPWFIREVAEEIGVGAQGTLIAPQLHFNDKRIEHIGWALLRELEDGDPVGRLYAESLSCALAVQLLRSGRRTVPLRSGGLPKRRLQRVLDYIGDNVSHDLSLSEIAAVSGLGVSHFKQQFRESMGTPVHRYVVSARVERALDLLLHTSIPISEVALRSGFANQSHLSRHLRRLHGVTPAALRREAR